MAKRGLKPGVRLERTERVLAEAKLQIVEAAEVIPEQLVWTESPRSLDLSEDAVSYTHLTLPTICSV